MKFFRALALLVGVAGLATGVGAGVWLSKSLAALEPGSQRVLPFDVPRGSGLSRVAARLQDAGLARNARALVLLARWKGWESRIQAGEYDLSPGMRAREILERIISGRVRTYTMVLPEGIRALEIAERLGVAGLAEPDAFMALVEDRAFARSLGIEGRGLEGYLYPETYELPKNLAAKKLARILVSQFDESWRQIEPLTEGVPLSKHEIVTLASIVEKETAAPEERPLIAAVFLNRLKKGMRLETDPTVIYGIENFDGNIRRHHLRDKSNPYNTYQIKGLPPGPIGSPGLEALRAIVEPADTEYLYFVSRNDGTHYFSRTYREHVNAVNRYQKRRRSR